MSEKAYNIFGAILLLMFAVTIIAQMIVMVTRFNKIERDLEIMKTVMIMKGIMPCELATKGD
jgi:hypothetical protein